MPNVFLRGGSGLGDSIYLRPIAEHLIAQGKQVVVLSNFPDIFIGSGATVERFKKERATFVAHYAGRRAQPTTQYEDMCITAGLPVLPLTFNWKIRNPDLIGELRERADRRKIVVVHGGRPPFGRSDGLGIEMVPRREAFDAVFDAISDCFLVCIGMDKQIYPMRCDWDLSGKTSVSDLLDLGKSADGFVGQCSFIIPLAEVFDKPLLIVWGAKGLISLHPTIRLIKPRKILHKASSHYAMDDWTEERIKEKARESLGVN